MSPGVALLGCAMAAVLVAAQLNQAPEVFGLQDPAELIQEDNVGGVNKEGQTGKDQVAGAGPASGGVDAVIPEFQDKEEWLHADKFMRNSYNEANDHYKKINEAEYKAP